MPLYIPPIDEKWLDKKPSRRVASGDDDDDDDSSEDIDLMAEFLASKEKEKSMVEPFMISSNDDPSSKKGGGEGEAGGEEQDNQKVPTKASSSSQQNDGSSRNKAISIDDSSDDDNDYNDDVNNNSKRSHSCLTENNKKAESSSSSSSASASASLDRKRQRQLPSSSSSWREVDECPVKLFATDQDMETGGSGHHLRHVMSLREILGFHEANWGGCYCPPPSVPSPAKSPVSMEFIVICNYMIDFDYLLEKVPELQFDCPRKVFFYQYGQGDKSIWRRVPNQQQQQQQDDTNSFAEFCELDPMKKLTKQGRQQYWGGTHHSKLFRKKLKKIKKREKAEKEIFVLLLFSLSPLPFL